MATAARNPHARSTNGCLRTHAALPTLSGTLCACRGDA